MRQTISVATHNREELIDITEEVRNVVKLSAIQDGLVALYAQGATGLGEGGRRETAEGGHISLLIPHPAPEPVGPASAGTHTIRHATLGRSKLQWSPLGGWPGL